LINAIEIFLQTKSITNRIDGREEFEVIGEQKTSTFYISKDIIYVDIEEQRPKVWPLMYSRGREVRSREDPLDGHHATSSRQITREQRKKRTQTTDQTQLIQQDSMGNSIKGLRPVKVNAVNLTSTVNDWAGETKERIEVSSCWFHPSKTVLLID